MEAGTRKNGVALATRPPSGWRPPAPMRHVKGPYIVSCGGRRTRKHRHRGPKVAFVTQEFRLQVRHIVFSLLLFLCLFRFCK
ncbi:hypothetical protein VTO73DRAFT_3840 [Trametes versicolor]